MPFSTPWPEPIGFIVLTQRPPTTIKKITPEFTAPIVEWNRERGFGFLQLGPDRVFLHIRDFARRGKTPTVGDIVQFRMGRDSQGRECAVQASHQPAASGPGGLDCGHLLLFPLLLILPALAILRFPFHFKITAGYLASISLVTWIFYAHDKSRAQSGGWRVPESTLHFLELLGGWPAAFLAQRFLRHKTSKRSFRTIFWLIIVLHQYAAFDFIQHWKFTSAAVTFIQKSARQQTR